MSLADPLLVARVMAQAQPLVLRAQPPHPPRPAPPRPGPALRRTLARQVGPGALLDWTQHYLALGLYGASLPLLERSAVQATGPPQDRWRARQRFEGVRFGCAGDYTYHAPSGPGSQ
eukprot:tig00021441_g21551.t2